MARKRADNVPYGDDEYTGESLSVWNIGGMAGSEMEMVVHVVLKVAIRKAGSESESNKFRPGTPCPARKESNLNPTTSLSSNTPASMILQ